LLQKDELLVRLLEMERRSAEEREEREKERKQAAADADRLQGSICHLEALLEVMRSQQERTDARIRELLRARGPGGEHGNGHGSDEDRGKGSGGSGDGDGDPPGAPAVLLASCRAEAATLSAQLAAARAEAAARGLAADRALARAAAREAAVAARERRLEAREGSLGGPASPWPALTPGSAPSSASGRPGTTTPPPAHACRGDDEKEADHPRGRAEEGDDGALAAGPCRGAPLSDPAGDGVFLVPPPPLLEKQADLARVGDAGADAARAPTPLTRGEEADIEELTSTLDSLHDFENFWSDMGIEDLQVDEVG